jgi:D123
MTAQLTHSREDLLRCQFFAWYAAFVGHTPKSVVLPLSAAFAAYLHDDSRGIILPEGFELR